MKTTQKKMMPAALVASSAFAFVTSSSSEARPIVPEGRVRLEYNKGGTDCSFTTYGQVSGNRIGHRRGMLRACAS